MTERTCSIEGCERRGRARSGLCETCYKRERLPRNGKVIQAPNALRVWIADAVNVRDRDGCWDDFPGGNDRGGYPVSGGSRGSHLSLELDGRPWHPPLGRNALHSCDNRSCLNPAHLRWGTHAANMADALARGRNIVPQLRAEVTRLRALLDQLTPEWELLE